MRRDGSLSALDMTGAAPRRSRGYFARAGDRALRARSPKAGAGTRTSRQKAESLRQGTPQSCRGSCAGLIERRLGMDAADTSRSNTIFGAVAAVAICAQRAIPLHVQQRSYFQPRQPAPARRSRHQVFEARVRSSRSCGAVLADQRPYLRPSCRRQPYSVKAEPGEYIHRAERRWTGIRRF